MVCAALRRQGGLPVFGEMACTLLCFDGVSERVICAALRRQGGQPGRGGKPVTRFSVVFQIAWSSATLRIQDGLPVCGEKACNLLCFNDVSEGVVSDEKACNPWYCRTDGRLWKGL